MLFGVGAVLFWSFGGALTCVGSGPMGVWFFIGITAMIGACVQVAFRRVYHGHLHGVLALPTALWLVTVFGFSLNVLSYPLALMTARSDSQRCAVNLINYLWPTLTVVCGVLWVPLVRFNRRVVLAVLCALMGTAAANYRSLGGLFSAGGPGEVPWDVRATLSYLLAFYGALSWAIYSSLLSRWREWARLYATAPLGLLTTGVVAIVVGLATHGPSLTATPAAATATLLCGLGTQGWGYLLWELALSRTNVRSLGLIGAMTPILSTLWLCVFLHHVPGVELAVAAVLVSGAVVLGVRS